MCTTETYWPQLNSSGGRSILLDGKLLSRPLTFSPPGDGYWWLLWQRELKNKGFWNLLPNSATSTHNIHMDNQLRDQRY